MVVIDLGGGVAPVGVAELKAWARISRDDEDELLKLLIAAASAATEAAIGTVLARRQFRLIVEERPRGGRIGLPKTPVVSVDALSGFGFDGDEIVFDPADHATLSRDGLSLVLSDRVWFASPNGIDITITAGLAAKDAPAAARHAIMVAGANWFEARTGAEDSAALALPREALGLLRSLRRVRI